MDKSIRKETFDKESEAPKTEKIEEKQQQKTPEDELDDFLQETEEWNNFILSDMTGNVVFYYSRFETISCEYLESLKDEFK